MQTAIKFNYQDYLQLPEDKRYEIIDEELFMAPSTNEAPQRILAYIFNIYLLRYCRRVRLKEIWV